MTACEVAISAFMNASISVSKCYLEADRFIALKRNVEGKVQFRRNSLRRPEEESSKLPSWLIHCKDVAVICSDSVSKPEVLTHDFKHPHTLTLNDDLSPFSVGATRESALEYEKHLEGICKTANWTSKLPKFDKKSWKFCLHCRQAPVDAPEKKFMYCARCQKVCYCSRECQKANWRDHKLVCAEKGAGKPSEKKSSRFGQFFDLVWIVLRFVLNLIIFCIGVCFFLLYYICTSGWRFIKWVLFEWKLPS